MNKFELTDETQTFNGILLHRIKALRTFGLRSFGSVTKGELGGWVEKEKNLSQKNNAWISDDAWVFDNAYVTDDAQIFGNARVYDNARVLDNARVFDNARVLDNARVFDNAKVSDNAWISDNAWVFDNAWILDNARVSDDAWVFDNARVYGNARVSDNAQVYGNAMVCGDTSKSPINITGLEYSITITDRHIKIGCEFHSIEQWEKFTESEIKSMDGHKANKFWNNYRESILNIAKQYQQK